MTWPFQGGILLRLAPVEAQPLLPNHRLGLLSQKLRDPVSGLMSAGEALDRLITPFQEAEARQSLSRLRLGRNLELAALPEGKLPYDFAPQPVDLNGLCRKAARQLEMPVEAAGCSLVFTDWKESLCTQCDDDLVLILIYHLVSNALRAAGKGGHLELRLERRGRRAFISLPPWPRPGRAWDWGSPSAATSPGSTRGRCCWPTERSGAFAPPSPSLSAGPAPPRRSILPAASIPPTACPWCCGS